MSYAHVKYEAYRCTKSDVTITNLFWVGHCYCMACMSSFSFPHKVGKKKGLDRLDYIAWWKYDIFTLIYPILVYHLFFTITQYCLYNKHCWYCENFSLSFLWANLFLDPSPLWVKFSLYLWNMISIVCYGFCLFHAFFLLHTFFFLRTFIFKRNMWHILLMHILFMLTFYMSHNMTHWLIRSDSLCVMTHFNSYGSLWLVEPDDSYYDSCIIVTHSIV